ncbi:MFS transporter [Luteimicrobium sp. DT211]|uniref:MFS transporter n=1 Tax=Luteimicrobium sp. DT211 TaxID=3393412 RepID=UPI003CF7024A
MASSLLTTRRTAARSAGLVLALLATAQLMLVLDVTVVNIALPDIGTDLGLSRAALPWVVSTYTVFFGGLMLAGGRMADRLGPRRAALIGLAVFTTASALCGLAQGQTELLASRALQGSAAALLSPAALATVLVATPQENHRRALSVWSGLAGIGVALGVVLGGVLTTAASWRWIFWINVPVGVALLVLIPRLVPGRRAADGRAAEALPLDLRGAALATATVGTTIYGLVSAGTRGWAAPEAWLALAAAAVLGSLFALAERASTAPLLRLELLRRRTVVAGAFLMLTATGLLVGAFFLGSFALQRAHGESALRTGLLFLPVAAGTVAGSHVGSRLLGRIGTRSIAPTGFALAAAGYALAAVVDGVAALVVGLGLVATGVGALFVTAFTASLSGVEPDESGLRSALVSTFHELGGAVGVALLSTVAGAALVASSPTPGDFARSFAVAAGAALACGVGAGFVMPRGLRPPDGARPMH